MKSFVHQSSKVCQLGIVLAKDSIWLSLLDFSFTSHRGDFSGKHDTPPMQLEE